MRLLALLLVLAAPVARADIDWPSSGSGSSAGCSVGCGVFFGITFGIDLAVDIADFVILGQGDHLRPGWGIVQGLWGGGHVVFGGIITAVGILGATVKGEGSGALLTLGLITLAEGILLIVVAVVSGVRYVQAKRREYAPPPRALPPQVSLRLEPKGGASALLTWAF
ncbi:MAG: hypothetical protein ACOZQL_26440 [Myxococcota bacterium]